MYEDGHEHISSSSHYLEIKIKYPEYKNNHLVRLEPESEKPLYQGPTDTVSAVNLDI